MYYNCILQTLNSSFLTEIDRSMVENIQNYRDWKQEIVVGPPFLKGALDEHT